MRGQRVDHGVVIHRGRIIPARAGPTSPRGGCMSCHADHPRSCGANTPRLAVRIAIFGSSPLVRGQPRLAHTPARYAPDHPRSCGANETRHSRVPRWSGSSPLVRGQPPEYAKITRLYRIIPARAGPTYRLSCTKSSPTDHPRSCGANAVFVIAACGMNGSSPLVRGQLTQ